MRRAIVGFAIGAAIMVAGPDLSGGASAKPEGPAYVQGAQAPRFQSGVDVTLLDVTVLDGDGQPVTDLKPSEFSVKIDGQDRRVVSAEWIPLASSAGTASTTPSAPVAYSSNAAGYGGRFVVIYIEDASIPFGQSRFLRPTLMALLDRLEPSDRVAVTHTCPGAKPVPFTTDRAAIARALTSIIGNGDPVMCPSPWTEIHRLLGDLRGIAEPKTLVLVSAGLSRGSSTAEPESLEAEEIERLAAQSRTTVYALLLDRRLPDTSPTDLQKDYSPDPDKQLQVDFDAASEARLNGRDGLSFLANGTGGALYTVAVGADTQIQKIEAAISGYYLVGVESDPGDRAARPLAVRVARNGLTVRSRNWLSPAGAPAELPPGADNKLKAAFGSSRTLSDVPLRVATFTMRQPDSSNVFVLLHAEIGADHRAPASITVGYTISKPDGTLVTTKAGTSTLAPMTPNAPSPLALTSTLTLDPGDYLLKLAVVDGARVGSVERPMHVGFAEAGAFTTSDLIAGGSASATPAARPPVASIVREGFVQGFFEVYGDGGGSLRARYDVLPREGTKPAATAEIGPASAAGKTVFAGTVDVHALPPGAYLLRATLIGRGGPLQTLTTGFERPRLP